MTAQPIKTYTDLIDRRWELAGQAQAGPTTLIRTRAYRSVLDGTPRFYPAPPITSKRPANLEFRPLDVRQRPNDTAGLSERTKEAFSSGRPVNLGGRSRRTRRGPTIRTRSAFQGRPLTEGLHTDPHELHGGPPARTLEIAIEGRPRSTITRLELSGSAE
jgi:hypothetical protein